MEEYYGLTGAEAKKFSRGLAIYNALDMIQKNYIHPSFFSDLVTLILVRPKIKKCFKG